MILSRASVDMLYTAAVLILILQIQYIYVLRGYAYFRASQDLQK